MKAKKTREEWLVGFTDFMRPHFKTAGYELPKKIRLTCGWPSSRALGGGKSRVLGQCWYPDSAKDRAVNIIISLFLDQSKEVAGTLIHELAHAATETHGHKGKFVQCIRAVGLLGKPKQAAGLGTELRKHLNVYLEKHGKYPHASVDGNINRKKQTTRLIKLSCQECGYTVRTTMKWLEVGVPSCCCGGGFEIELPESE